MAGNDDNPYASPRSGPFPMPDHPFSYLDREIFEPGLKRLGIRAYGLPHAVNSIEYRNRSACTTCRRCIFCPTGARYSPDRVLVPILDASSNVTIVDNVSLRRLETSSGGDRIVASHVMRVRERTPLIVRATHFVLALGGVGTPRLLLLFADERTHLRGLGNIGGQLGRGVSGHAAQCVFLELEGPVGGALGFLTMGTDHFREHINRHERPRFMVFAGPALAPGYFAAEWA